MKGYLPHYHQILMRFKLTAVFLRYGLSCLLLAMPLANHADYFEPHASYNVYFTPTHDCSQKVIQAIQEARSSIYVQAYFLTAENIISALLEAKLRGVDIHVLLDKNHREHQLNIKRMRKGQIPIWIDQASGIAHNKVMIIDQQQVITGSFNFTYSANHRNRENILFIQDRKLAKRYLENWYRCQKKAIKEPELRPNKKQIKTTKHEDVIKLVIVIGGLSFIVWKHL